MTDTRFKAEKGIWAIGPNSTFESNVYVNGSTFFVGVDLIIGGNLVYANTSLAGDLIPSLPGAALGNSTNRFAVWAASIDANTQIIPSTSGLPLGNNTNRWLTYTANLDSNGSLTVSGNVTVNTTAFLVDATNKRVGINTAPGAFALTVAGVSSLTGNVSITGNATITGAATITGVSTVGSLALANGGLTTNTTAVSTGAATTVDSWPKATGHAAKMTVFVDGSALPTPVIHSLDMLIIHDGTNVLMTKYGEIYNTSLGSFDASITGANVNVTFTATSANTYYVKSIRQLMS